MNSAPNGSFEKGTERPDDWSWTDDENGAWKWTAEGAREGSRAMMLEMPGEAVRRGPALTSARFPIQPNTPYTFSWSARTNGLSHGIDVTVVEESATGAAVPHAQPGRSGTNDWSESTIRFTTGPAATKAYFKVEQGHGAGTAWVDDFRAMDLFGGRAPAAFREATVNPDAGGATLSARSDGLELTSRWKSVGTAIRVDMSLSDTTGRDRAIELSFRLPIDLTSWRWDQTLAASVPVSPGVRYENLDASFGFHTHSTLPLASVRSERAAVALAVPMGPAMLRFGADAASGFSATWDVGLSPAARKAPSRATFTFWIYPVDARWGLRAAAEKYYVLVPEAFSTTVKRPGAWITSGNDRWMRGVRDFADFGWGFNEGPTDLAFSNENGILALRYVDASGWFRKFPEGARPPYEQVVAGLQEDAAAGQGSYNNVPRKEMAQAVVNSSPFDERGRYQVEADPYFWYSRRLQIYPVSPDSDIPAPSIWSVLTHYWVDVPLESARRKGGRYDGLFLDDLSSTFAHVENHRRELWAYSDLPLSFSYASGRVALYDGSSMAEFCAALRDREKAKGLFLFGSSNPGIVAWFAPHLDALGGEVSGAEPLDRAYVRRTVSYGKPWTNLLVPRSGGGAAAAPQVEAYLRQALLLGYFPGFDGRYWGDADARERDRPLFRKYIPLIRELVETGWKPVHGVVDPDPDVLVERFDDESKEVFYLTVQNGGAAAKAVRLALDNRRLGIPRGQPVHARELLSGAAVPATNGGDTTTLSGQLAPGETEVFEISVPGRVAGSAAAHTAAKN